MHGVGRVALGLEVGLLGSELDQEMPVRGVVQLHTFFERDDRQVAACRAERQQNK